MKLLSHTVGILTQPEAEWTSIREEKDSKWSVYFWHVPFLALIPVIATYFGVTQVGWDFAGKHMYLTKESALQLAVLAYFANLGMVVVLGEFIDWMAPTFTDEDNPKQRGMTMAVFLTTPVFLSGLVFLYPHLWLCATVALFAVSWAVFLCYEGMPILMEIPKERAFIFSSSVLTAGLVLLVVMMISSVIIWSLGAGPEYTSFPS